MVVVELFKFVVVSTLLDGVFALLLDPTGLSFKSIGVRAVPVIPLVVRRMHGSSPSSWSSACSGDVPIIVERLWVLAKVPVMNCRLRLHFQ